jgi:hypothetical protein
MTRIGRAVALLALAGALVLPASVLPASAATAGDGPTASKSGAIINYKSGKKLKIGKRIQILVVCSVDCNVVSKSTIKGPGVKLRGTVSGQLQAGAVGGPFFKPNGPLLKAMKATPGKFRLINRITATDPATGATDAISRSFRLKR